MTYEQGYSCDVGDCGCDVRAGVDLSGTGDDDLACESTGGDVSLWVGCGGLAFVQAEAAQPGAVAGGDAAFWQILRNPDLKFTVEFRVFEYHGTLVQ